MKRPTKLDKRVKAALDATGLPWELEPGSKHYKLKLKGIQIGVIPYGVKALRSDEISVKKSLKTIAVTARKLKGEI